MGKLTVCLCPDENNVTKSKKNEVIENRGEYLGKCASIGKRSTSRSQSDWLPISPVGVFEMVELVGADAGRWKISLDLSFPIHTWGL